MKFQQLLKQWDWDEVSQQIKTQTLAQVMEALNQNRPTLIHLMALLSPAAQTLLENLAHQSYKLTRQRFGKVIHLYIPVYLSNICENHCVYCGFKASNPMQRKSLSPQELIKEAQAIARTPFKHILLVSGEAGQKVGCNYFEAAIEMFTPFFSQISLEVQPLQSHEYEKLIQKGLHGVFIYQETYHQRHYPLYHLKGPKSDFDFRLETPERLGKAGVRKIGLGTLIGLEDWRTEAFFTALHLSYLRKKYWKTNYSVSFPRLRPIAGQGFQPPYTTTERDLTQLICAYRLFDPDLELSLSTRESPKFRDHVFPLGITAMSAGSKTNPGAYDHQQSLEQFSINDERSPEQIAQMIHAKGFEPVWKDWSLFLQHQSTDSVNHTALHG